MSHPSFKGRYCELSTRLSVDFDLFPAIRELVGRVKFLAEAIPNAR